MKNNILFKMLTKDAIYIFNSVFGAQTIALSIFR